MRVNSESVHAILKGTRRPVPVLAAVVMLLLAFSPVAHAVPETTSVRIADVTASSFSVVWMTDVSAVPDVEVYSDNAMLQRLSVGIMITSHPTGSSRVAQAAQTKGIMKVRVAGVMPATTYYVRTVTKDPLNPESIAYSTLQQVTTATSVILYSSASGTEKASANDLATFPVYVRPTDQAAEPRLGDLVILENGSSPYPISAFVGDGVLSPEGLLDLNNLFGMEGTNLDVAGGETIILRTYRAGNLSTLTQYRRAPLNSRVVSVATPTTGFFADINLDGKVDDGDFVLFKAQYRTAPNDGAYNPDYKFVTETDAPVNIRDFSKFSKEYGRTNVE